MAGWLGGAIVLGLVLFLPAPCGGQAPPTLDFLYVESTVDDAAGGHTAVRLGDSVFHYQHYPDGLFLLVNDAWEDFRRLYNDRQSRSITLTRIPISRESCDRVRSHFTTRYVLQERRLRLLDQLTEEQELLEKLAAGIDAMPLEGLGFFSEGRAVSPRALELKGIVERELGTAWLSGRLNAATLELEEISRSAAAPDRPAGWSVRLREVLSLREALVLLDDGRSLADDALVIAGGNCGPLTDREKAIGEEFRRELADSVLSLLGSERPDRGSALLLQMARYQALGRSLDTGVLATLDPFPEPMERASPDAVTKRDRGDDDPLLEARSELAAFRGAFLADSGMRAAAYSRIETAHGILSEIARARGRGSPVSIEEGLHLPGRRRAVRTGLRGRVEEFAQAARAAALNRERFRAEVEEAYRYNLFTRNCVTEIVRDVNDSFEDRDQVLEHLGGSLEPGEGLSFVPFRLPTVVRAAFPSNETEVLPAYRLRQLERLYERSGRLVWLRENNTATSTLYTPSWADDSVFLFFTDDVVAPRPLLGTLNLVYAAANAASGLLLAPADGGRHLTRSLRGMLYSLPEIAFFNIRKGSFRGAAEAFDEHP